MGKLFWGTSYELSCTCGIVFLQTTDAMEIMLLSILSPIVKCEWHLKDWEEAMITAVSDIFLMWLGNEASHERV